MSQGRIAARLRPMIQRAMGKMTVHRVRIVGLDVATLATTGVITRLLLADDDPDYDLNSNGTTIAECQAKSKIVKVDLQVIIYTTNATSFEIGLFRDPDNAALFSTTAGNLAAQLFDPDYTTINAEAKRNLLFYRFVTIGDRTAPVTRVRIKGKALRRAGTLNDNDSLEMIFNSLGNSAGAVAHIVGRIYTRMP